MMTRLEIDKLWGVCTEEAIKNGELETRFRFAEQVWYRAQKPLVDKIRELEYMLEEELFSMGVESSDTQQRQ